MSLPGLAIFEKPKGSLQSSLPLKLDPVPGVLQTSDITGFELHPHRNLPLLSCTLKGYEVFHKER